MSPRLQDQVIVITGGGSGLGQAAALKCLHEGASVVICDISPKAGADTLDLARKADPAARIDFVECDVTDESSIIALMDHALSTFGDLHCVLNNAGHGMSTDPVTELSVDDWDRAHALLARAPFMGTKYGALAMQRQGHGGSVINMASIAGLSAGAGPLGYSTFKAAVINFSKAAAVQLAPSGIRVNSISPGLILTPLNAYIGRDEDNLRKTGEFFATLQPLPEFGKAEHIAAAVVYLASSDASWVTGHNLVVDGGNSINNLISDRVYEWVGQVTQ